jgi:hypothetical protein
MADSTKDAAIGKPVTLYVKKPAPQRSGYKVSQWTKKRVQFELQTIDAGSGSVQGVLLTVHRNRPRKASENKIESNANQSIATPSLATSPASPDPSGQLYQGYSGRYSLHTFLSPTDTLLYRCK